MLPPGGSRARAARDCRGRAGRRYRRAVATRRLPLSAVIVATAFALVAALGTFALLDGGGDDGDASTATDDDTSAEGYELTPAGELPSSNAAVRLASLDGGEDRALGELFGTPVVVNFFASWCVPCIDEMPAFERVHQAVGDQVTIIGMANRDAPADALATVEATGVTYPTYDDPDASALTWFGGLGMPTTVFIDAAGEVVDVNSGALTEAELRAKVADLFGVAA
jgi:cytochrome c biogenesis protein CcmG, thiol:disulfide interchange protein DsbE